MFQAPSQIPQYCSMLEIMLRRDTAQRSLRKVPWKITNKP